MVRWIWLGIAVCATWRSAAAARWPDGVLNYCGFEGYWDEAGWRDLGWAQGGTPGIGFDRNVHRFGKASLRIEGAVGQSRAVLQLNGNAVRPGKRYVLRVWVKVHRIEGEAAVALQPHEEGKPLALVELGEKSRLRGTHDWVLLEVPVPPLPEKVTRIYSYLWVKGPGTAWFDEFALTEAGVEVPLGGERPVCEADYAGIRFCDSALPKNLLKNAGFEAGTAGWFIESGKPEIDEAAAAAGRRSLRCDGFAECRYSVVQVRVPVDPRRAYRLSLRMKTALQAGLSCVQLLPLNARREVLGYFSQDHTCEFCYGRGSQDWHEQSVLLRQFAPEVASVNLYLLLEDALGTVWFDDVQLTPLSTAETAKVRQIHH